MAKTVKVNLSFGSSGLFEKEIDLLNKLVTSDTEVVFTKEFDLLAKTLEARVSSLSNSIKLYSDKGLDCKKVVDEMIFLVDLMSKLCNLKNKSIQIDSKVRCHIYDAMLYFNTLRADTVELVKAKEEGIL